MSAEDKPFSNRADVKKDIRLCAWMGEVVTFISIGFAVVGVLGDALNITLGLESMSWFLLAIWAGLLAIIPSMRSMTAKHLFGIESESKNE